MSDEAYLTFYQLRWITLFLKSQRLNIASFVTFYRATSSQITSLKSVTLMYRRYGFSARSKILNFDLNFLFCDNLLP